MKLKVTSAKGAATSKEVSLSKDVFGIEPNDHAIYLDVKQHLANRRQGTHKAKERGEIQGSTKKIKKQKIILLHFHVSWQKIIFFHGVKKEMWF